MVLYDENERGGQKNQDRSTVVNGMDGRTFVRIQKKWIQLEEKPPYWIAGKSASRNA